MVDNGVYSNNTSNKGTIYDVPSLNFQEGDMLSLGNLVTGTSHFMYEPAFSENEADDYGVIIYQDRENPNIGYRININYRNKYMDFDSDYLYKNVKLYRLQKNIKLTQFPLGVITYGGRVIGEIIPFYDKCISLSDYLLQNPGKIDELKIQVMATVKELFNNNIRYMDFNPSNFVVTGENDHLRVHLIDFESMYLRFSNNEDINLIFSDVDMMFNRIIEDNKNRRSVK